MQEPNADSVLGDFNDATFEYNGFTSRFYRSGDKYMVRTDGADGEPADFEVAYVFGVYPLQQYLLPLSNGRLQSLSIAWDARPQSEGGQRWYHLHPDEAVDHSDPLHWTGPYYNWNGRCAECHSTDVKKNYDAAGDRFDTTFEEIDAGCEACHGPGHKHLALARAAQLADAVNGGFPVQLSQRGNWALADGAAIAVRTEPLTSQQQIDTCGRCHARRGTLGEYRHGAPLLDTHRLSLPRPPLYHPDGQILDEVYVYGSFVQSKMHQAGVVCSNCHEPHSQQLRAAGNGVCAQCHVPSEYDTTAHHHHPQGSSGALCANCHMPETTYMGVDPRRDHSMRVPRPDLSLTIGVPNACNQCHADRDAMWALNSLRERGVQFRDTASHPARAFHALGRGDQRAVASIAQLAVDPDTAPIWRAAAMDALGETGGREALQAATTLLYDDDPLLRASTVRALGFMPPQQRYRLLTPLLQDPVTSVRMEVASSLAQVPLQQLPQQQAQQLGALFEEYEAVLGQHTDMPETHLQLGVFRLARGDLPGAEQAYRAAIARNKQLLPAYLNLADLMRADQRDDEAAALLARALEIAPDNGATLHALGLLETRRGNKDKALDYLGRAAQLETGGTRHRFVNAIALHDLGQPQAAIRQLQALLAVAPHNLEVLQALANYAAELGDRDKALGYAKKLVELAPGNSGYQQLYRQLSGAAQRP